MLKQLLPALICFLALANPNFAQVPVTPISGQDTVSRPIITAVPFLTIAPDARSAGMGDVGVATTPDANSVHWNPAKLAFIEKKSGVGISVTPWLQNLVGDMYLYYLSGYTKISQNEAIAFSMRYFDLGSMDFTDINRNLITTVNPREYAFDATYSRKLSNSFGMGVTARYIRSNLTGNFSSGPGSNDIRPANSISADVSAYYVNNDLLLGKYRSKLALGANMSNIGPKITYTDRSQRDFIPTNFRLGTALTTEFDSYNKLTFAFDVNKLMVPTPPALNPDGTINVGRDPSDIGWVGGMFRSFGDAPGGFGEELRELILSTGAEYWYNDLVAIRGGYFHENARKGNRQYFTLGLGLRYQVFGIDFAYLISRVQNNPLQDTIRFTLLFNLNGKSDDTKYESTGN